MTLKIVKKKFSRNCYFYSNKLPKGTRYMYQKVIKSVKSDFSIMSGNNNFKTGDYKCCFLS